jgi:hypothetical protein
VKHRAWHVNLMQMNSGGFGSVGGVANDGLEVGAFPLTPPASPRLRRAGNFAKATMGRLPSPQGRGFVDGRFLKSLALLFLPSATDGFPAPWEEGF